ncbi:MAG: methionyl-tRNA formyltransferase [Nitrospirales bacterium]
MRYILLGNGQVASTILDWLVQNGEPPVGLVVHPDEQSRCRVELINSTQLSHDSIFDATTLRTPETLTAIRNLQPDLGISLSLGYILKKEFLSCFPLGCINLHPSLLPYNRGSYPNVWSIIEGTPSGVTLHYINEGIDTGDILSQEQVPADFYDTGETLYRKLESASISLFKRTWPAFKKGEIQCYPQEKTGGTYHKTQDVRDLDEVFLDREYSARYLIDLLRARSFPPYKGAYFVHEGKKVFMKLALEEEG